MTVTEPLRTREVEETALGVVMYPPTAAKPYYRLVWRDVTGQRQQALAGRDHDAAWEKALRIDDELRALIVDPEGRTVAQLAEAWLTDMATEWSVLHLDKGKAMREKYIDPYLGPLPCGTLPKEPVTELLKVPTASSTKRHLRAAVGKMLTWGYQYDWTPSPRAFYLPPRANNAKQSEGRVHGESNMFIDPKLRPDPNACGELAARLAYQAGDRHGEQAWLMAAVAATTGVREGELWAALVSSLRVEAGELDVLIQVVRPKGGGARITPPKWGRTRTTFIPENTMWGEPLAERLDAYLSGKELGDLAFPTKRGTYFHPSNFSRDWLDAARAAAAPTWHAEWKWHSFRHAFCTDLLNQDAKATDVAAVAGHRHSGVTLAMYVGQTAGTLGRLQAVSKVARRA